MKKIYALLLLLGISLSCFGQNGGKLLDVLPLEKGKIVYSGVITVDSVTKDELYNRARIWMVNAYRSSKDVIQLDDKPNGTLIGKGYIPTSWQVTFYFVQTVNLRHTLMLQFKDGRFRYEITDLVMEYYDAPSKYTSGGNRSIELEKFNGGSREANTKKYYTQVDEKIKTIIADLEKAVRSPAKDW